MSVNMGSATGYLDLNVTSFVSGLKTAQSQADTTSKGIEKTFDSVGSKMKSVGKMATVFITTPLVTAVTGVVKNFGDLEQAIGGVETLFKDSAKIVIDNAEKAYKTAGVSATSYMEQITSISARLLQGLSGDTVTAAKVADMAIIDMSDNANKFGSDLGSLQIAYQGFAKGNFAMLDNLKLGYGGTAEEMARLIKDSGVVNEEFEVTADNIKDLPLHLLYEGIHKIQENLGLSGTTAKEASSTISGSFATAKASVVDFLAQLGNPGANIELFADNVYQSFYNVFENVKRVVTTLWDNLPIADWQKKFIVAAAAFGPVVLGAGKVVTAIGAIIPVAMTAATWVGKVGADFVLLKSGQALAGAELSKFSFLLAGISAPILAIAAVVGVLIGAFVSLWKTNEQFREDIIRIWNTIQIAVSEFLQGITDRINSLGFDFENITEVIQTIWQNFCLFLAPIFTGVFAQIANVLSATFDIILGLLDIFIGIFTGNWNLVFAGAKDIFNTFIEFWKKTFNLGFVTFQKATEEILSWFGTSWTNLWSSVKDYFANMWQGIVDFFNTTIDSIKVAAQDFVNAVTDFFAQLPENIILFLKDAFTIVKDWGANMVKKSQETGQSFLDTIILFFNDLPYKVGYIIGFVLGSVVKWTIDMIAKARETGTNFVKNLIDFISNLPSKLKALLDQTITNVVAWFNAMVVQAINTGTTFVNNIINFISGLPSKLKAILDQVISSVFNWASNMATKARNAGTNFVNNAVDYISGLPSKIKGYLDDAVEQARVWVGQLASKGYAGMMGFVNSAVSAGKTLYDRMLSIGSDLVSGVWQGILDAKKWFTTKVSDFFGGIVDGVKRVLKINSPSKVMADEIGKWLPPGVVVGFEKAMPKAMDSISTVLNKGIDKIKVNDISIGASASIDNFSSAAKSIYGDVAVWFETVESKLGTSISNMTDGLATLIKTGNLAVDTTNGLSLGYVGYNELSGVSRNRKVVAEPTATSNQRTQGDTFNFYSPKAINEVEAANQLKRAKRDLSEGF